MTHERGEGELATAVVQIPAGTTRETTFTDPHHVEGQPRLPPHLLRDGGPAMATLRR